MEFGDLVRSLPFQLPENFLLVIRAMSLTSGVSSSLAPAFNIWDAVEPYSAQLIRDESGNAIQDVAKRALSTASMIARMPGRVDDLLTRIDEGRLSIQAPRLERRITSLDRTGRRLISVILFAVLLLGGVLLRAQDLVFGTVVLAVSVLPLLHALFAGIVGRRGR
jgi:predicted unusual protein kinase regulating ubiquinone biosynthesis (AarF/ABC1/UbiB family)